MLKAGSMENFSIRDTLILICFSCRRDVSPKERRCTSLGARWYEVPTNDIPDAHPISELPVRLTETTDEILKYGYAVHFWSSFRIVRPELELHRKLNVALPRSHPALRRKPS